MATRSSEESAAALRGRLRRTALGLLARRDHTRLELRQKLLARNFPETEVTAELARLEAEGLLSERRFAEVYAHSRLDKGYGPLRVSRELKERGVADEVVAETLAVLDEFWARRLAELVRRRFGGPPADAVERERRQRFLR
ncbi:MAG TPA: regulatory protein RecX, partial [Candidatus Competibacteraceae bacterium]|nr:regulatory protein RecX [Candidatus Competibacteraceae bacterium]